MVSLEFARVLEFPSVLSFVTAQAIMLITVNSQ